MANSKVKGNSFERKIAKQWSLWWTQDDPEPRDDCFWRTASSGGRATQRSKKGKDTKNQYSDITASDPIGQPLMDVMVIETKFGYSKNTIADLLDAPDNAAVQQYEEWIVNLRKSRDLSGALYWLLLVQRNRRETIAYMDSALWDALWTAGADLPVMANFQIRINSVMVYAIKFKEFLQKVSRRNVEAVAQGKVK